MAKTLKDWVKTDVAKVKKKPLKWLSEEYFFRVPTRPLYSDAEFMFAPADGIILYQKWVKPDAPIVDIKGKPYSLRDAMRDDDYNEESLVIGIFMTMYDVHVNRIPYAGYLSYRELEPISSYNCPMLDIEKGLIDELMVRNTNSVYLHNNQRLLNRIYAPELQQWYYILQIADYDVDCITPFDLSQNEAVSQTEPFSQIRFGSQVDLILPKSSLFEFETLQDCGMHVEGGVDPIIRIHAHDKPDTTPH
ncbi:MAG: phosphatidylserine decarboxylase [Pseudomonadota bacterium]